MEITGIEIEVVKKKIKNLYLTVLPPNGIVRISAPITISDEAIELFAISRIAWVKKQIEKYQNQPRQTEREYVSGESHYFLGKRYRMEVKYTNGNNKVEIQGNKIIFTVRSDSTAAQRENILNAWYRRELRTRMQPIFQKWATSIGVEVNEVKIKDMRTKWGTCNTKDKRIWLNLQLAKKPTECIEYVVVHELVHLLENSHNARFVIIMDEVLPDWRTRRQQLNDSILQAYELGIK
ncbi:M48 family metallopeptidase [Anaerotignum sp.]|uniref:M48 family metallopeptidase n=1 Tax=Anaerotignum sp. TaxID=2039241 RepID=UPI0028B21887|nr:SprT family zinc-dependent metalloprotease [Anaerotignum sp.]